MVPIEENVSDKSFTVFGEGRKMRPRTFTSAVIAGACIIVLLSGSQTASPQSQTTSVNPPPRAVLDKYCITCHNQRSRTAGLALDTADVGNAGTSPELWEKVIAKLRAGSMPPPGNIAPDSDTYRAVASWPENEIERAWAVERNPG